MEAMQEIYIHKNRIASLSSQLLLQAAHQYEMLMLKLLFLTQTAILEQSALTQ